MITTVTSTSLDDVSGIFALTRDLGLSPTQYGFASASWAVGIVAGSWLGSRITEKPLVYGGSALVLCALANVLGRVVLARGGCE